MTGESALVTRLYERFAARDMAGLLAMMHPDVLWANGMAGGHVGDREGVRDYWTRQWAMIDPAVTPIAFATAPARLASSRSTRSCAISKAVSSPRSGSATSFASRTA